ncbi:hypothetical protein LTR74_018460 [Friedmanniomyces endolithicus]|nr:hypothetical protein LTR74_018460 [Friedmanniomyces endolithicus]
MDSNRSLINHVLLPPQLPQALDDLPIDFLLRSTLEALAAFKLICLDPILAQVGQMLENTQDIHSNGHVNEAKLTDLLNALHRKRGMLVLHIDAQNAESSLPTLPPQSGRLRRSFPGSAVDIDFTTFAESGFVATTAHTLSKMSHQPVPGMQPQVKKAGEYVDEDRDTTHPAMITELFMAFLRSLGWSVQVTAISKNTREEVMWNDARSPWRRSSVWLLLRASLQLKLPHCLYKEFMAFMMGRILGAPHSQILSSDLRYAMMAKVARRLFKLSPAMNTEMVQYVQDVLRDTMATLEKQLLRLQVQKPLDLSSLHSLNFEQDGLTAIPALDEYLKSIAARQSSSQQSTTFQHVSRLVVFGPWVLPRLSDIGHNDYTNQNLFGFETWVTLHLGDWSVAHRSDSDACEMLGTLMKSYHGLAYRQYANNPEATSVSHLTIIQLWMALDVCALHLCPLLGDYDAGMSLDWAHNLLLPSRDQMERLSEAKEYFQISHVVVVDLH